MVLFLTPHLLDVIPIKLTQPYTKNIWGSFGVPHTSRCFIVRCDAKLNAATNFNFIPTKKHSHRLFQPSSTIFQALSYGVPVYHGIFKLVHYNHCTMSCTFASSADFRRRNRSNYIQKWVAPYLRTLKAE